MGFRGRLEQSADGSKLRGSLEVVDGGNLRFVFRVLRLITVVPIVIAAVLLIGGLQSGHVPMNNVLFALAIGLGPFFALQRVEASGLEAAAADARWLIDTLGRTLG
jgi:hypothetical protein